MAFTDICDLFAAVQVSKSTASSQASRVRASRASLASDIQSDPPALRERAIAMARLVRHRGPGWSGLYARGSAFRRLRALIVVLVGSLWHAPAWAGIPALQGFDDLPVDTPVFNQYSGVLFVGGDQTNLDASHPVTIVAPAAGTSSGTQAVQGHFLSACEFCGTSMTLAFSEPQYRVSIRTGIGMPGLMTDTTIVMEGFADDPALPDSVPITTAVAPCLGANLTPIATPLGVFDALSRLQYIRLHLVECSDPFNFIAGPNQGILVLDDLVYDRPLNPTVGETIPPIIHFVSPMEGQTVVGQIPGAISLVVSTAIEETALANVTLSVNGGTPFPVAFFHTDPTDYSAAAYLDETNGLVAGANTVVMNAVDFDSPPNTTTGTLSFVYQIKPIPPPSKVDLWPIGFEVNQAIDLGVRRLTDIDRNFGGDGFKVSVGGSPHLARGKPAVVRVYGAAANTATAIDHVPATFHVEKDGCSSDCTLALALPSMATASTFNTTGIRLEPIGTPAASVAATFPDLTRTWNFLLPGDWTQQDLVVTINVNNGQYTGTLPNQKFADECTGGGDLECFHNNQVELHIHFEDPPVLTVTPVHIHVTGTRNGMTFTDVQPTDAQVNNIFQSLNELYPFRIVRGARVDRTVDPGISKGDLLDLIDDLDAGDHELKIGLFPGPNKAFAANEMMADGSIVAGYGAVGGRGAWADANLAADPAHELAHNIGFDHWACENGVTADECGVFPIPHGGIGGIGFDIANWKVIVPGDSSSNSTPHAHDFMSYGQLCGLYGGGAGCDLGEWVSWYTYDILWNHPFADSYDTEDPPALLVSGTIGPRAGATLKPTFQTTTTKPFTDSFPEDDADDVYTLSGLDAQGGVLYVHNFEPRKLDDHDSDYAKHFTFDEAVPLVASIAKLVLTKGRATLATLTASAAGPAVTIDAPTAGASWGAGSLQTVSWTATSPVGAPLVAFVLYSPDGGRTMIPLARNVSGSSFSISADELPSSSNGTIYVQVSEGLRQAVASVGIVVAPKSPAVHVITPKNESSVDILLPVALEGTASTHEELLADSAYAWSSDRDGTLGTGPRVTAAALSAGHHQITLTVTDSNGRTGTDVVTVDVIVPGTASGGGGGGSGCSCDTASPSDTAQGFWSSVLLLAMLGVVARRPAAARPIRATSARTPDRTG
ncbi:MAG TPA: hypothetical protein VFH68_03905 [Polyangia bacterium]|nr:hypothetical protein [Polyangia bacterium]